MNFVLMIGVWMNWKVSLDDSVYKFNHKKRHYHIEEKQLHMTLNTIFSVGWTCDIMLSAHATHVYLTCNPSFLEHQDGGNTTTMLSVVY